MDFVHLLFHLFKQTNTEDSYTTLETMRRSTLLSYMPGYFFIIFYLLCLFHKTMSLICIYPVTWQPSTSACAARHTSQYHTLFFIFNHSPLVEKFLNTRINYLANVSQYDNLCTEWVGIRNPLKENILHAPILQTSKDYISAIWQPGTDFMYDNTPINTAGVIENWLHENCIPLVEWLYNYPIWTLLSKSNFKERIYTLSRSWVVCWDLKPIKNARL